MRILSESEKLRRRLPLGDAALAKICLARGFKFYVDADWSRNVQFFRFPHETLRRLTVLLRRRG